MPKSFPPLVAPGARVLILGSMPGAASLKKKQYYAHPQNQFWRLLGEVLGEKLAEASYEARFEILAKRKIALWDVLAECSREGSLDADISDEEPNRIAELLRETGIKSVFLNGGKAQAAFKQFIEDGMPSGVSVRRLPSSSPAHAGLTYAEKLDVWRAIADAL
jgi:hypoxanthine-DNA glycosylase